MTARPTTSTTLRGRLLSGPARLGTTLLAVTGGLGLFAIAPASADTAAPPPVTFTDVGEHPVTVPDGVTSMHVVAIGGAGGNGSGLTVSIGGQGARVESDVPVTPGEQLYAEVGDHGRPPVFFVPVGLGGANGGGDGYGGGGGGGGASDVRTVSCPTQTGCSTASLNSRLVVAAGGGGGGAGAGQPGGDGGAPVGGSGTGTFGTGADQFGSYPYNDINNGYGGHFGVGSGYSSTWLEPGGGGGGGWYGGDFGIGGGGGGSSHSVGTALYGTSTGAASVTISWNLAGAAPTVPAAPAVQVEAGEGELLIYATEFDGGSPVTGYTVNIGNGRGTLGIEAVSDSPALPLVYRVPDGDSYTVTVQATNAVGTGPASAVSDPVTPGAATAAPVLHAPIEFDQYVGEAQTQTAVVRNPGPTALDLTALTVDGPYTVDPTGCTSAPIPAHSACTVPVTFRPTSTASGASYGHLVASGPFPGSTVSTGLTGIAYPARPLKVATTQLPHATVGAPYSATLTADNVGPVQWSVDGTGAPLPDGLTLDSATGLISGIPTAPYDATPQFTVTDPSGLRPPGHVALPLVVAPAPLQVTTTGLPAGTVGTAYHAELSATGGDGAVSWSTGEQLPAGLTLDPVTGVLGGTPTAAFTGTVHVIATDSVSGSAAADLPLSISSAPQPDLRIALARSGRFLHGRLGTYTVRIGNTGTAATAQTTTATMTLPSGLTPVSASGQGWACRTSGRTVTCTHAARLAAAATSTLHLSVRIPAPVGAVLKTTATVTPTDATAADNTATDTVRVQRR